MGLHPIIVPTSYRGATGCGSRRGDVGTCGAASRNTPPHAIGGVDSTGGMWAVVGLHPIILPTSHMGCGVLPIGGYRINPTWGIENQSHMGNMGWGSCRGCCGALWGSRALWGCKVLFLWGTVECGSYRGMWFL